MYSEEIISAFASLLEEKYQMSGEQVTAVARVVWLTFIGKITMKSFINQLVEHGRVDPKTARSLASDINEQIFQPVRNELLQVHGIQENIEAGASGVKEGAANYNEPEIQAKTSESHIERQQIPEPAPPAPQVNNEDAARRREDLLARLRASQDAPYKPQTQSPANKELPKEPEPPKAVTTAWNGKTIDLSMIPPRRQLNGNGKHALNDGEEKIVKLKKGPDGYWYEV